MSKQAAQYSTAGARQIGAFLDAVSPMIGGDARATGEQLLDHVRGSSGPAVPPQLDELLGLVDKGSEARIMDAVAIGVRKFTAEHGTEPTADVVEAAIQQGRSALFGVGQDGRVLDSATSAAHDPGSLQPNRAVVAILSAIAEAIPFASYLPVDIASNESKLAILSHTAGSNYGDYTTGEIMDGVSVGDVYTSSSRMVQFDHSAAAPYNSRFSERNLALTPGFCDPAATGVPVLRGRTMVYVNGRRVAMDQLQGNAANSPISGSVRLNGTDHVISGYVTPANGNIQLTSVTPDFPVGAVVTAQAFVDYETAPALIPSVVVRADTFALYANPWRVMTAISIDAQTQIRNELGIDANSEALMMIRTQMAMERHYLALRMVADLGMNNVVPYNYDVSTQIAQKNRAQIWQDFQYVLGVADQNMANLTMDHGITHLYVSASIAAQWQALPADLFVSSGITARPGIYRVGRLFGKYEVYYSPKVAFEAANGSTATIIAVGRSSQVARCPIVLGDAVAPTFLNLATQSDLRAQAAMYARDFTVVNPHEPSALGCARINVTGLA